MDEKRLKFLLRRGMKELDVMVSRYHDGRYAEAPVQERETFVRLLSEVEDPDIWSWAMGYAEVPADYQAVIEQMRVYR